MDDPNPLETALFLLKKAFASSKEEKKLLEEVAVIFSKLIKPEQTKLVRAFLDNVRHKDSLDLQTSRSIPMIYLTLCVLKHICEHALEMTTEGRRRFFSLPSGELANLASRCFSWIRQHDENGFMNDANMNRWDQKVYLVPLIKMELILQLLHEYIALRTIVLEVEAIRKAMAETVKPRTSQKRRRSFEQEPSLSSQAQEALTSQKRRRSFEQEPSLSSQAQEALACGDLPELKKCVARNRLVLKNLNFAADTEEENPCLEWLQEIGCSGEGVQSSSTSQCLSLLETAKKENSREFLRLCAEKFALLGDNDQKEIMQRVCTNPSVLCIFQAGGLFSIGRDRMTAHLAHFVFHLEKCVVEMIESEYKRSENREVLDYLKQRRDNATSYIHHMAQCFNYGMLFTVSMQKEMNVAVDLMTRWLNFVKKAQPDDVFELMVKAAAGVDEQALLAAANTFCFLSSEHQIGQIQRVFSHEKCATIFQTTGLFGKMGANGFISANFAFMLFSFEAYALTSALNIFKDDLTPAELFWFTNCLQESDSCKEESTGKVHYDMALQNLKRAAEVVLQNFTKWKRIEDRIKRRREMLNILALVKVYKAANKDSKAGGDVVNAFRCWTVKSDDDLKVLKDFLKSKDTRVLRSFIAVVRKACMNCADESTDDELYDLLKRFHCADQDTAKPDETWKK